MDYGLRHQATNLQYNIHEAKEAAMTEESPFQPGRPVKASGFSGREDLVNKLVDTAESACRGRFQVAYISGERGIGKSH